MTVHEIVVAGAVVFFLSVVDFAFTLFVGSFFKYTTESREAACGRPLVR